MSSLFSRSVLSDFLQPQGLHHARLPCPSPNPWTCSNSCSWVSDVIQTSYPLLTPSPPAFNHFPSPPASRSFLMSQFFTTCDQSIGASASASVLPMNFQDCFPLGLTEFISLQPEGLSRVFSRTTVQRHQFFSAQHSLYSNFHIYT